MSDGYTIYVVRHAIAEERGDAYPDDTLRPLSAKGIAKFTKAARGLAALEVSLDCILSSSLVRARQTADILAAELRGHPEVREVNALAPEGTFAALSAELGKCSHFESIALVGHEPSIGELAARLIGLKSPLEFKKGAVCCMEVDSLPPTAPAHLRWFATSKMLAAIKR